MTDTMRIIPPDRLALSYRHCADVSRGRARNFYYSFLVLPREKRNAMCAVYAFMRLCDDLADDPEVKGDRSALLGKWRRSLDDALRGDCGDSLLLPAFVDAVRRFDIPPQHFHQLIDGAEADLTVSRYETFDDLRDYCYKVASTVALVCIHIYGFDDPKAIDYAEKGGIAFQLTNILRDLGEDCADDRIYLPQEDLREFGYTEDDLLNGVQDERFRALMEFEVARARDFYNSAFPIVPLIHPSGRHSMLAMVEVYYGLLQRIEKSNYDVFSRRISLPAGRKVAIAVKSLLRYKLGGGRSFLPEPRS